MTGNFLKITTLAGVITINFSTSLSSAELPREKILAQHQTVVYNRAITQLFNAINLHDCKQLHMLLASGYAAYLPNAPINQQPLFQAICHACAVSNSTALDILLDYFCTRYPKNPRFSLLFPALMTLHNQNSLFFEKILTVDQDLLLTNYYLKSNHQNFSYNYKQKAFLLKLSILQEVLSYGSPALVKNSTNSRVLERTAQEYQKAAQKLSSLVVFFKSTLTNPLALKELQPLFDEIYRNFSQGKFDLLPTFMNRLINGRNLVVLTYLPHAVPTRSLLYGNFDQYPLAQLLEMLGVELRAQFTHTGPLFQHVLERLQFQQDSTEILQVLNLIKFIHTSLDMLKSIENHLAYMTKLMDAVQCPIDIINHLKPLSRAVAQNNPLLLTDEFIKRCAHTCMQDFRYALLLAIKQNNRGCVQRLLTAHIVLSKEIQDDALQLIGYRLQNESLSGTQIANLVFMRNILLMHTSMHGSLRGNLNALWL